MKTSTTLYHAGCPVYVHLGEASSRVAEAESSGVKLVPAQVSGGQPSHINFGAAIADLK